MLLVRKAPSTAGRAPVDCSDAQEQSHRPMRFRPVETVLHEAPTMRSKAGHSATRTNSRRHQRQSLPHSIYIFHRFILCFAGFENSDSLYTQQQKVTALSTLVFIFPSEYMLRKRERWCDDYKIACACALQCTRMTLRIYCMRKSNQLRKNAQKSSAFKKENTYDSSAREVSAPRRRTGRSEPIRSAASVCRWQLSE